VKKAGGVAFKFVSLGRRSVPDRIVLLPAAVSSLSNAKHPANHHAPTSCASTNGCALGFTVVVLDSKNLEGVLF